MFKEKQRQNEVCIIVTRLTAKPSAEVEELFDRAVAMTEETEN